MTLRDCQLRYDRREPEEYWRREMGNMEHCRFENTTEDLRDCHDHMDDDDLSDAETKALKRLIKIYCEIAADYGDDDE